MSVDKPRDAEGVWKDLKECILSEAISVCGETKGISRHKETWWWYDKVAALVQEKKPLFRLWKGPRKCKCQERCRCKKRCRCGNCKCREKTGVLGHPPDVNAQENYNMTKRAAKLAIFNAKNAERLKFCEKLEDVDRKGDVFRMAKQLVSRPGSRTQGSRLESTWTSEVESSRIHLPPPPFCTSAIGFRSSRLIF